MSAHTAAPAKATGGPHPGILGLVSLGLLIGSLISMAVISGEGTITSPFGDTDAATRFFAEHGFAVQFAAMLQLGSAIPLGIYAATVYARQLRLGIRVPGPAIGLFGGIAAASCSPCPRASPGRRGRTWLARTLA